ncbi:MAG: AMP-binding protein, partial [Ruminococcus sp.]|nr:AMP-binding protein [Ruminococcus sp.]
MRLFGGEFRCQIHDSYQIIRECTQVKKHYEGYIKQLCFLPFYHVFGLIAMYIWFAFFSRAFVQLNDLAPQTILNTIKRHKVTHIFAVPLFWETVYDQAIKTIRNRGEKTFKKFQKGMAIARRLSGSPALSRAFSKKAFREVRDNLFGESIIFLITGGSAIRPEVIEFFNAIGYHLADGYGMTEIGITSVELSDSPRVRNACFVGKPMTYAAYQINEKGELLVRGKVIAKYVIEDGKKTVTDKSAWFNTHDLAECVDGRYRILGRADDLIVAPNGENLNPNLTEPQLRIAGANGVCLIKDGKTPVLLVSVNRYTAPDQLQRLDGAFKEKIAALHLTGQIGRIVYTSAPLMADDEFKLNRRRLSDDCRAGRLPLLDKKQQKVELSATAPIKILSVIPEKTVNGFSSTTACTQMGMIDDKITCSITLKYEPSVTTKVEQNILSIVWHDADATDAMQKTSKIVVTLGATSPVVEEPKPIQKSEP